MRNVIRRVFFPVVSLLAACSGGSSGPTGPSGPPVVTLVNGATLPSGTVGTTVVIQGSNFGTTQAIAAGHVLFSTTAGGRDTATIAAGADWTNNLIVTTVPAGVPQGTDTLFVKTSGGVSSPVIFTVLKAVTFNPSTISWTSTTALPVGLSGHAIAAATLPGVTPTSVVYVVGGGKDSTNAPRDSVLYATVSSTGTVGAWTKTTVLPAPVAFAAALVATPANSPVTGSSYLYVIGGDSTASGKPVATVYLGTLSATGAVTGWATTTALPAPVHSVGAAIFNGNVYVAGGSGTGNAPVATVYRAAINSDGTLGAWQALTALPFARSYFGFGVNGTFLYALGGDSAAVSPNDSSVKGSAISDVVYAQIDVRTGNLVAGGWIANGNKLKKAVSKHTAVVAGGNVLITAGLYSGASSGATEESYAALNADGSTGAFNGATGSNTISSAGGGNLFNHAATGYLDGSGAFHVLVVGGDDVNTPTVAKHTGVFYH
ncbi:MAG TPA: hypothetical protein VKQ05_14060 [Gemmatimonadales bacterium]|nr:hypothetical protein [Gemmatimonadales bacterium]